MFLQLFAAAAAAAVVDRMIISCLYPSLLPFSLRLWCRMDCACCGSMASLSHWGILLLLLSQGRSRKTISG